MPSRLNRRKDSPIRMQDHILLQKIVYHLDPRDYLANKTSINTRTIMPSITTYWITDECQNQPCLVPLISTLSLTQIPRPLAVISILILPSIHQHNIHLVLSPPYIFHLYNVGLAQVPFETYAANILTILRSSLIGNIVNNPSPLIIKAKVLMNLFHQSSPIFQVAWEVLRQLKSLTLRLAIISTVHRRQERAPRPLHRHLWVQFLVVQVLVQFPSICSVVLVTQMVISLTARPILSSHYLGMLSRSARDDDTTRSRGCINALGQTAISRMALWTIWTPTSLCKNMVWSAAPMVSLFDITFSHSLLRLACRVQGATKTVA